MPPAGVSCAIVLPGAGSDAVFVRSAFGGPLTAAGMRLLAPAPRPGAGVVDAYRAALDGALAQPGRLLVGGVSLGAHVAVRWAADIMWTTPGRLAGLLLALPAWTGPAGRDNAGPGSPGPENPGPGNPGPENAAPAAVAARASAALARAGGIRAALAPALDVAPAWLTAELGRAWAGYGDDLADSLDAAAAEPGPSEEQLRGLTLPVGLVASVDDPVHPLSVAQHWHDLLPRSALVTTDLATFGPDPAVLGRAALSAWSRACEG